MAGGPTARTVRADTEGRGMAKTCSNCKTEKPLDDFNRERSRSDGRQRTCRECHSAYIKRYQQQPEVKARRRAYHSSEKGKETKRRYVATPKGREVRREAARKWQQANKEKVRVHSELHRAVRRGELERPDGCERCGKEGPTDAHHADYGKPLEVEWICRQCHRAEHMEVEHG